LAKSVPPSGSESGFTQLIFDAWQSAESAGRPWLSNFAPAFFQATIDTIVAVRQTACSYSRCGFYVFEGVLGTDEFRVALHFVRGRHEPVRGCDL